MRAACTSISCIRNYSTVQGCYGISCCQTTIPSIDDYYLTSYSVDFSSTPDGEGNSTGGSNSSSFFIGLLLSQIFLQWDLSHKTFVLNIA